MPCLVKQTQNEAALKSDVVLKLSPDVLTKLSVHTLNSLSIPMSSTEFMLRSTKVVYGKDL